MADFSIPALLAGADDQTDLPTYLAQAMQGYQNGMPDQSGLPSYLAYAMANPQLAQTPVAQASTPTDQQQANQANSLAMLQASTPQLSPIQQMFQNQATNPNLAMANGMIGAGSAIMGGDNLQKGLAAAGPAFQQGFNGTLDQQRKLNTPSVTPLVDGSFLASQLPGQAPTISSNPAVQNFLMGRAQLQGQMGLMKTIVAQQMRQQGQEAQQARATAIQAAPKALQADQALNIMQQALDIVTNGRSAGEKLAAWNPQIGGALGYGAQNQVLARVGVDSQLAQGAVKAGVVTQGMFDKFESDIPKATDSDDIWKSFLNRNIPFIQKISDYQHSLVNAGANSNGLTSQASQGVLGNGGAPSGPVRGNGASYIQ